MAKRNAAANAPAVRYRIAEGYSEALMLLGRYEDANTELDANKLVKERVQDKETRIINVPEK